MQIMKFSVVVPVYNGGKYIKKLVEGIQNQSYKDFELIVINDGSMDNTKEILEGYKHLPYVKIINSAHRGVSGARNLGIKHASGDYIAFWDCDDSADKDFLLEFSQKQKDYPKFLIVSNIKKCILEKSEVVKTNVSEGVLSLNDFYLLYQNAILSSCCNKIYSNEIIKAHNLRFNEEITYGEDLIFNLDYLNYVDGIYVIQKALYEYNITEEGSHTKIYSFRDSELLASFNKILALADRYNLAGYPRRIIYTKMLEEYALALSGCVFYAEDEKLTNMLKMIKRIYQSPAYNMAAKTMDEARILPYLKKVMGTKSVSLTYLYFLISKFRKSLKSR